MTPMTPTDPQDSVIWPNNLYEDGLSTPPQKCSPGESAVRPLKACSLRAAMRSVRLRPVSRWLTPVVRCPRQGGGKAELLTGLALQITLRLF